MIIPSCFSNPSSVSSSSSSSGSQNLVTCIYQTRISSSPIHLTLTWSKILFSHSLTIHGADDMFSITIPLQASTFSLFQSRSGSKTVETMGSQKMKVYWDFTRAQYGDNSAEPESGFYVAIIWQSKLEFFVGDRLRELIQRAGSGLARCAAEATLLSRREHVFGRRMSYTTRAVFLGTKHEFGIECGGGMLKVKVDGEVRLVVKRLAWKFRGNEKILVGGMEVEFYWDVFNWVSKCDSHNSSKFRKGHGVFVFQIGDVGVWPEMVGVEKKLVRKSLSLATGTTVSPSSVSLSPSFLSPTCSSVLQWAEESSDCGRSSCSSSTYYPNSGGFTLLLYAWRKA